MSNVGVEAIAVITGSFLSGAMMSVYLLAVPSLFDTTTDPGHLLRHWSRIFLNGHIKGPIICLTTTALYGLAAITKYSAGETWGVFAAAGVTTISMVPFTLTLMAPTNEALFKLEGEVKKGNTPTWSDAERLVRNWNRFNATRAFFPLAGAILGLLGALQLVSF
ncbi:hypothetical protein BDW59DRAFT_164963 [Aspergillus cavernicola]|uniref:DUF1772-domain-containing protein n=1 Tax=Aspergillus cavernicola TaxID=176166 RepID=A0ABR4HVV7_9EURO